MRKYYCTKCLTFLEDSQKHCLKCGEVEVKIIDINVQINNSKDY